MKKEENDLVSPLGDCNASFVAGIKSPPQVNRIRNLLLLSMAIIAITVAVYWQVGGHGFIDFDDTDYVTANPHVATGITGPNLVWAFTSAHSSNWHPITWVSLMADAQVYGNPGGFHLTNVLIHAVSAALLFLLLFRLTGCIWRSSFVAAMFALHPLHVESVAWVAERKDVLSAFFLFLTLLSYASYVGKKNKSLYILTLISFILGLMSKPMLVTLPLLMLLLDFWPLNRYGLEAGRSDRAPSNALVSLLKEKIPFFACSLFSAVITVFAQHSGRAMNKVSFELGFGNAILAYIKYVTMALWPHDLAIFYPLPASIPAWQVAGSIFLLLLVSTITIWARRRYPFLALGWFWYLVTLVPVVGIIPVGEQSIADRYTYLPLTGLFIVVAWGCPILIKDLPCRRSILTVFAVFSVTVSAALTWQQLAYWHDSVSLFRHAIEVTPRNHTIHTMMGNALAGKGELKAAINEYKEALRISPDYSKAQINLGIVHNYLANDLAGKGKFEEAIHEYREVIAISPNSSEAHNNLGIALAKKGNLNDAAKEFRIALKLNPNSAEAQNNLEFALSKSGVQ